jgi:methylenetetrahydrofolate reductase (NADPH)
VKHHIENRIYHIEILTPKQNSEKLDEDLDKFAEKYNTVMDAGYVACITDNPMGHLSFQATDIIPELGLPVKPEQLMIHLNTFHTKDALDQILDTAAKMGVKYFLVITGDGNERLPKLKPEAIGESCNSITSVELLRYIRNRHPGVFTLGVAFNPYEPQDHELEKMHRKVAAGAEFICTQPIIGKDDRVYALKQFGLPVVIDAWMSKKLHLLSECVGYTIPEDTPYDPIANLHELRKAYPECGLYLALVSYKNHFPVLKDVWK